jgi:hypothetical protein
LTNTFRGYHHDSINGSYFLAGGQTTGDVIQIQSGDLYNHYGNTIAVNSLCVRSIP